MYEVEIRQAALYYAASHRRRVVEVDVALREETVALAEEMRRIIAASLLPPAVYGERKCGSCSLEPLCMPRVRSGAGWLERLVAG